MSQMDPIDIYIILYPNTKGDIFFSVPPTITIQSVTEQASTDIRKLNTLYLIRSLWVKTGLQQQKYQKAFTLKETEHLYSIMSGSEKKQRKKLKTFLEFNKNEGIT